MVVADDDPLVRMLLTGMLSDPGVELVGESDDGAGVLETVARLRPDVVLLDPAMPDLDGLSVIRALRSATNPPAVVVLTSFETEEQVAAARRAGAQAEVMKSARQPDLLAVIDSAAAGRK